MRRRTQRRALAGAALLVAAAATTWLVLRGTEPSQTVHLRFADAGQLIEGNRVNVGGIAVGKVERLELTADQRADVVVRIEDPRFVPLRTGTTATIRTVGLSGVTNRYVALAPGGGAPIPDGGVLPETQTRPIVDIDLLLDSVTPDVREDIRRGTRAGSRVLDGAVEPARGTLRYATAALSRADAFARQLTADRQSFSDLLRSGATVADTVATRESDVTAGIGNVATTLAAVLAARRELSDGLRRAPVTLASATRTLRELRPTLAALDPALAAARPAARPLARVLRRMPPALRRARPVLADLGATLDDVDPALAQLPPLTTAALPALRTTRTTLDRVRPIVAGLAPYANDIVQGAVRGLGSGSSFNYDANGNLLRIGLGIPTTNLLTPLLGRDLPPVGPPGFAPATGRVDRCPGSATVAAADGSSRPAPAGNPCDPAKDPAG